MTCIIFQSGSAENIKLIVKEAEDIFETTVKESFQKLALTVPQNQYFRFQQSFCHSIQVKIKTFGRITCTT